MAAAKAGPFASKECTMKNILIIYTKKVCSNMNSAIISLIVVSLCAGSVIVCLFYKHLWLSLMDAVQSPTPLWVTIALMFLVGVYICLKTRSYYSKELRYKIHYFTFFGYKWRMRIYNDREKHFEVDRIPLCKIHDLPLLKDPNNSSLYCPEFPNKTCNSSISQSMHCELYRRAVIYIDREVRNNKY